MVKVSLQRANDGAATDTDAASSVVNETRSTISKGKQGGAAVRKSLLRAKKDEAIEAEEESRQHRVVHPHVEKSQRESDGGRNCANEEEDNERDEPSLSPRPSQSSKGQGEAELRRRIWIALAEWEDVAASKKEDERLSLSPLAKPLSTANEDCVASERDEKSLLSAKASSLSKASTSVNESYSDSERDEQSSLLAKASLASFSANEDFASQGDEQSSLSLINPALSANKGNTSEQDERLSSSLVNPSSSTHEDDDNAKQDDASSPQSPFCKEKNVRSSSSFAKSSSWANGDNVVSRRDEQSSPFSPSKPCSTKTEELRRRILVALADRESRIRQQRQWQPRTHRSFESEPRGRRERGGDGGGEGKEPDSRRHSVSQRGNSRTTPNLKKKEIDDKRGIERAGRDDSSSLKRLRKKRENHDDARRITTEPRPRPLERRSSRNISPLSSVQSRENEKALQASSASASFASGDNGSRSQHEKKTERLLPPSPPPSRILSPSRNRPSSRSRVFPEAPLPQSRSDGGARSDDLSPRDGAIATATRNKLSSLLEDARNPKTKMDQSRNDIAEEEATQPLSSSARSANGDSGSYSKEVKETKRQSKSPPPSRILSPSRNRPSSRSRLVPEASLSPSRHDGNARSDDLSPREGGIAAASRDKLSSLLEDAGNPKTTKEDRCQSDGNARSDTLSPRNGDAISAESQAKLSSLLEGSRSRKTKKEDPEDSDESEFSIGTESSSVVELLRSAKARYERMLRERGEISAGGKADSDGGGGKRGNNAHRRPPRPDAPPAAPVPTSAPAPGPSVAEQGGPVDSYLLDEDKDTPRLLASATSLRSEHRLDLFDSPQTSERKSIRRPPPSPSSPPTGRTHRLHGRERGEEGIFRPLMVPGGRDREERQRQQATSRVVDVPTEESTNINLRVSADKIEDDKEKDNSIVDASCVEEGSPAGGRSGSVASVNSQRNGLMSGSRSRGGHSPGMPRSESGSVGERASALMTVEKSSLSSMSLSLSSTDSTAQVKDEKRNGDDEDKEDELPPWLAKKARTATATAAAIAADAAMVGMDECKKKMEKKYREETTEVMLTFSDEYNGNDEKKEEVVEEEDSKMMSESASTDLLEVETATTNAAHINEKQADAEKDFKDTEAADEAGIVVEMDGEKEGLLPSGITDDEVQGGRGRNQKAPRRDLPPYNQSYNNSSQCNKKSLRELLRESKAKLAAAATIVPADIDERHEDQDSGDGGGNDDGDGSDAKLPSSAPGKKINATGEQGGDSYGYDDNWLPPAIGDEPVPGAKKSDASTSFMMPLGEDFLELEGNGSGSNNNFKVAVDALSSASATAPAVEEPAVDFINAAKRALDCNAGNTPSSVFVEQRTDSVEMADWAGGGLQACGCGGDTGEESNDLEMWKNVFSLSLPRKNESEGGERVRDEAVTLDSVSTVAVNTNRRKEEMEEASFHWLSPADNDDAVVQKREESKLTQQQSVADGAGAEAGRCEESRGREGRQNDGDEKTAAEANDDAAVEAAVLEDKGTLEKTNEEEEREWCTNDRGAAKGRLPLIYKKSNSDREHRRIRCASSAKTRWQLMKHDDEEEGTEETVASFLQAQTDRIQDDVRRSLGAKAIAEAMLNGYTPAEDNKQCARCRMPLMRPPPDGAALVAAQSHHPPSEECVVCAEYALSLDEAVASAMEIDPVIQSSELRKAHVLEARARALRARANEKARAMAAAESSEKALIEQQDHAEEERAQVQRAFEEAELDVRWKANELRKVGEAAARAREEAQKAMEMALQDKEGGGGALQEAKKGAAEAKEVWLEAEEEYVQALKARVHAELAVHIADDAVMKAVEQKEKAVSELDDMGRVVTQCKYDLDRHSVEQAFASEMLSECLRDLEELKAAGQEAEAKALAISESAVREKDEAEADLRSIRRDLADAETNIAAIHDAVESAASYRSLTVRDAKGAIDAAEEKEEELRIVMGGLHAMARELTRVRDLDSEQVPDPVGASENDSSFNEIVVSPEGDKANNLSDTSAATKDKKDFHLSDAPLEEEEESARIHVSNVGKCKESAIRKADPLPEDVESIPEPDPTASPSFEDSVHRNDKIAPSERPEQKEDPASAITTSSEASEGELIEENVSEATDTVTVEAADIDPKITSSWNFYRKVVGLVNTRWKYQEIFEDLQSDPLFPYLDSLPGVREASNKDKQIEQKARPAYFDMSQSSICEYLVHDAKNVQPKLVKACKVIAKKMGIKQLGVGPVKDVSVAMNKAKKKYKGDVLKVTDFCRAFFIVNDIATLLALIETSFDLFDSSIWRVKLSTLRQGHRSLPGGYRDCKINLVIDNHICEIQVHLQPMWEVCKVQGYAHYKESILYSTDPTNDPYVLLKGLDERTLALLSEVGKNAVKGSSIDQQAEESEKKFGDYHALSGILLEEGKGAEAERMLRKLLSAHCSIDSLSLQGRGIHLKKALERSLRQQGENLEADGIALELAQVTTQMASEKKSVWASLLYDPQVALEMIIDPAKKDRDYEEKLKKTVNDSKQHWLMIREEYFRHLRKKRVADYLLAYLNRQLLH